MTRKEIRDKIKLSFGLNPDREDGNLSDAYFNDAINDAIKTVALDCNLLPVESTFPLVEGQYKYPLADDCAYIQEMAIIDSDGNYNKMKYLSPEQFMREGNPATDTTDTPEYFSYPHYQGAVIHWWAQAPDVYDYVTQSHVTENTVRTLVDSGANFGKTLSGYRIEPGAKVHNLADKSYGYVESLGVSTIKAQGTATLATTNRLTDTSKNFVNLNVQIDDIICVPATGRIESYAFVTEVGATYLEYANIQGSNVRIRTGDTYKVGIATEITLSGSIPHPGLRYGIQNTFYVGDSVATITGTTFNSTTVTGTISGTPVAGYVVIASSGQHALITVVETSYLSVDKWIGGLPDDGTSCVVKQCDSYQIETKGMIQRMAQIGPTPNQSDAIGTESVYMLYNKVPSLPEDDNDILEIDDRYKEVLFKCSYWQASQMSGKYNIQEITAFEAVYDLEASKYKEDINKPPIGQPNTVWGNRTQNNKSRGSLIFWNQ
jgi:hypothetical protein